jgi:hypothetical protein
MIAYKLFRKDKAGNLKSLFINKTTPLPFDTWLQAEEYPTKGFAVRKGWHCCFQPVAPHLKEHPKNGMHRVWCKVEVEEVTTYDRPESQGGAWILAQKIRLIEELSD